MDNWLNDAIVYEIYPQSYYDTNHDGIGDLQGIIQKLDYIRDCGFNAIWLNPINKSAFRDAGYDVTDYYQVDPRYGTNRDYQELCRKAHAQGMRVIFDLVPGHTSNEHPWFQQSAKAELNEYSNRYIWTDGTFEEGVEGIIGFGERDGGYITNFFWSQPALNYGYAHPDPKKPWQLPVNHPDCVATKQELLRIIDFWMDMGTDAFRVDMASSLVKGDTDQKYTNALWQEVRQHIEERNSECLLISEWSQPAKAVKAGFHCDFLLHCEKPYTSLLRHEEGRNTTKSWIGHSYFHKDGKGNINDYLDDYLRNCEEIGNKGVIGMITGNHDMQRLAYRRTPEEIKAAMVFLFTMPGVPFVYYGDEIGMDYIEGLPSKEGGYIRTGARTPMQWNDKKNHGFSESDTPYLPTDEREDAPTVEKQMQDENSVLSFVKKLITVRKTYSAFLPQAELEILLAGYPFVYRRKYGHQKLFVAINPSDSKHYYDMPAIKNIIISQNLTMDSNRLVMGGVSFIVAEEE